MEVLISKSNQILEDISVDFKRSLHQKIDWNDRLVSIVGARGTGKTTLLLQYIKEEFGVGSKAVYVSLDDIYFSENKLVDFVDDFVRHGGDFIAIDEVHKYPNWAKEIKNIYDFHKKLKIVFTGSSVVDMNRQNVDLSRRAIQYHLSGLSFREYLSFSKVVDFPQLTLVDLLKNHETISLSLSKKIKVIPHFKDYLKFGYYPFYIENKNSFNLKLEQVVRLITESDLQFIEGFDPHNARKVQQLLVILSRNVPFKPNVSKLSEKIGIHRSTLIQYIHYLEIAKLVNCLSAQGKSISILQKPDKLFLENTNLMYVLSGDVPDKGSMREVFFMNQLKNGGYNLSLPAEGDFIVNDQYTFEIGGKDKTQKQIAKVKNSFVVADDIEIGVINKIPLWMFGLLY